MPHVITRAPAAEDVARIAAMDERVLRNLRITQCYADLAAAMRTRTADRADWCTFATWASRQAGSTIRGEDLLERFERKLGTRTLLMRALQAFNRRLLGRGLLDPDTRLGRIVREVHTPFDAIERASDAVAAGNLKVFAEIGSEFARFLATVPPDAAPDSPDFLRFAGDLKPGPPPEGQDYLREAFAHYQQQRCETDPRSAAAWVLLANLKIGLHEQTRLQPEIARAMLAPVATARDLGDRVLHLLIPGSRHWIRAIHDPASTAAGAVAARIHGAAVAVTNEIVTEAMMVLWLPNGVLALGRNLDAPVPEVFRSVTHPALQAFIDRYDTCGGNGDCGARDWSNLLERMHYILHLFRAYAAEPRIYVAPFTPGEVDDFMNGRIPGGNI